MLQSNAIAYDAIKNKERLALWPWKRSLTVVTQNKYNFPKIQVCTEISKIIDNLLITFLNGQELN